MRLNDPPQIPGSFPPSVPPSRGEKACLVFGQAAQQLGKRGFFNRYQTVFNGENRPNQCLIIRQRSPQPLRTRCQIGTGRGYAVAQEGLARVRDLPRRGAQAGLAPAQTATITRLAAQPPHELSYRTGSMGYHA